MAKFFMGVPPGFWQALCGLIHRNFGYASADRPMAGRLTGAWVRYTFVVHVQRLDHLLLDRLGKAKYAFNGAVGQVDEGLLDAA